MNTELIELTRLRWRFLRMLRTPDSFLVDYRLLRNFIRSYKTVGASA
jgi:hypothetical protein